MVFLLGKVKGDIVPHRFCGGPDDYGHFIGGMYFSSFGLNS